MLKQNQSEKLLKSKFFEENTFSSPSENDDLIVNNLFP